MADKQGPAQKLVYGLPEHLKGKAAPDKKEGGGHEEGDRRFAAEEWEGAPADHRSEDADTGVPGTSSPKKGHTPETVEGREGWRD